jgi:hypothetical protein
MLLWVPLIVQAAIAMLTCVFSLVVAIFGKILVRHSFVARNASMATDSRLLLQWGVTSS